MGNNALVSPNNFRILKKRHTAISQIQPDHIIISGVTKVYQSNLLSDKEIIVSYVGRNEKVIDGGLAITPIENGQFLNLYSIDNVEDDDRKVEKQQADYYLLMQR